MDKHIWEDQHLSDGVRLQVGKPPSIQPRQGRRLAPLRPRNARNKAIWGSPDHPGPGKLGPGRMSSRFGAIPRPITCNCRGSRGAAAIFGCSTDQSSIRGRVGFGRDESTGLDRRLAGAPLTLSRRFGLHDLLPLWRVCSDLFKSRAAVDLGEKRLGPGRKRTMAACIS